MSQNRVVAALVVLALVAVAFAGDAAKPATQPSKSQPAFDLLKTTVGDWQTAEGAKEKAVVSYKLIAADSVIMESMDCHGGGMVSMYHLDNDQLMMTHYCPAQNQPRMCAEPLKPGDKSLTFNFFDGTNIPSPQAGHMHKLTITFLDGDHMNQQWVFFENGKEAQAVMLQYERVKK